jgi:hypothetical protein
MFCLARALRMARAAIAGTVARQARNVKGRRHRRTVMPAQAGIQ